MVRTADRRFFVQPVAKVKAAARSRVLVVGELGVEGRGRPSLLDRLAARLRRAGDDVIATSSRPGRLWRALDMVLTVWTARAGVDVAIVDVDGAAGVRRAEAVTRLARSGGLPVILLLRGATLVGVGRQEPDRLGRLLASSHAVVTLTGHLPESLGLPPESCEVIPDPIEVAAYPFRSRRAVVPHFLWQYDGEPGEALEEAMLTVEILIAEDVLPPVPDVHLTLLGAHGYGTHGRLDRIARRRGLASSISITESVTGATPQERFAHHDVFINACDVDRAAIGICEAMAAGLCVVAYDDGGARYLVGHGVDGLLVKPHDPRETAAAIARLYTEPDLAERLTTAATRKAEGFDWSSALPRWQELIARTVTFGRGSP